MKAHTHDEFNEFGNATRRFLIGVAAFIGLFAGLMLMLRNLASWVLDVLKVLH